MAFMGLGLESMGVGEITTAVEFSEEISESLSHSMVPKAKRTQCLLKSQNVQASHVVVHQSVPSSNCFTAPSSSEALCPSG